MREHHSLPRLIELAGRQCDDAAALLQTALAERRGAQAQLSQLETYLSDYEQRLADSARLGLTGANYHNFRQFIATLDDAISQQNRVIGVLETQVQRAHAQWNKARRRLRSYEALRERQAKQRALQAERQAQRLSDELVTQRHRRALHPH